MAKLKIKGNWLLDHVQCTCDDLIIMLFTYCYITLSRKNTKTLNKISNFKGLYAVWNKTDLDNGIKLSLNLCSYVVNLKKFERFVLKISGLQNCIVLYLNLSNFQ